MLLHRSAHAFPGVAHHQDHVPPRRDLAEAGELALLQNLVHAGNGQDIPVRHGVPGIDGQIQQHLLNLVLIGQNPSLPAGLGLHGKMNAGMDKPADHGAQTRDNAV